MELILQKKLPHQQKAVDAICDVLTDVEIKAPVQFYANPRITLSDHHLAANLYELQQNVRAEYRSNAPIGHCLNLDVKMETGTGKTYVYSKIMFELHKRYGLNKFLIVVPSLAIKAGTAQFLQDEYVRRHFADGCGYDTEIEVGVPEAPKSKKKGHSYFPGVISDFVKGSCQNSNKIYVLLVNMQLLTGAKILTRDDYDYGVQGFYRPLDAIRATHPVVIIDEPHRFSRTQNAFQVITDDIKPQCIIRFGATFPELSRGRGNKIKFKDYQNLLYDLNACESFNQNLIKGVAKEHFEPVSKREEKVKILSVSSKDSVSFQYKRKDEPTKSYTLKTGDSLSIISDAFRGVTVSAICTTTVEFSNGVEKSAGEELEVDIYMTSYQEQMMRLALERHFEVEKVNFCGRTFKIKTLALFFIDDITSYRPDPEGKSPYLLLTFERLLKERIESTLATLTDHDGEYCAYLKASLSNVAACHAGYFSQDNSDSDEKIADEVDKILHGKKQLLSFHNTDGSFNTLRFLFSKWTLKEGWDNPNVFTIAKLRSSGSEISKLQEVGRGLRLPVDENGNRISNEEFMLNYIVDFTEADFAKRLVEQINGEIPQASFISEERLREVARKRCVTSDELFDELYDKHYIDRLMNIKTETRNAFFTEYPEFTSGLAAGKVKDNNNAKPKRIKIRKAAYKEIRELWEAINQRYLLFYDDNLDDDIKKALPSLLEQEVFTEMTMSSQRESVESVDGHMTTVAESGVQYIVTRPIAYGEFLKRIMRVTNIPIAVMHEAVCTYIAKHGNIEPRYINANSISAFCANFQAWKNEMLQGRFHYIKSNVPVSSTALTYADGSPREDIMQGRIGTKIVPGTPSQKYLYNAYTFDSPLEKQNLMVDIEEVVVYGKIPRSSIAIPTIAGGMYSPDFMYVVKRSSGEKEINIVVETKDVEDKSELRGMENANINCAEVFFQTLTHDGYTVHFHKQLNNKQVKQIIEEVLVNG